MGNQKTKSKASNKFEQDQNDVDLLDMLERDIGSDQCTLPVLDKCYEKQDAHAYFPFNTIGRVVSVFYDQNIQNQVDLPYGTGTLIHPRVVLTCGHNIYSRSLKTLADHVYFQPETHSRKPGPYIRAKYYGIHREFFDQYFPKCQQYDIALLILEENTYTAKITPLGLNLEYNFIRKESDDKTILLYGYPKKQNIGKNKFCQYGDEIKFKNAKGSFVIYNKTFTSQGHSGSPLILKQQDQNNKFVYSLVGIHKGNKKKSYGLLLSHSKNQLLDILKKYEFVRNKENIETLQKFIQSQVQISLKDTHKKPEGVKWRKLISEEKIQFYLEKDQDPSSYSYSLHRILQSFDEFREENGDDLILNLKGFEFLCKKFIYLKLNPDEQMTLFKKLEEIIQVSFKNQKQIDEIKYCRKVGEWTHQFHSSVNFKKRSWIAANNEKQFRLLSDDCLQVRNRTLNLLKKSSASIDLKKRKTEVSKRMANFYQGCKNLEKAKDFKDQQKKSQSYQTA